MRNPRRRREPEPRMYMHDVRLPGLGGAIVSTACLGPECPVCAGDPAAAKRAENPHFPWPEGEGPSDEGDHERTN